MRKFIYLIGSIDDFDGIEDLKNTYFNGGDTDRNMSVIPVELDPSCRVSGLDTIEDVAVLIARGIAFTNDWCLDDTFSCLLEA